MTRVRPACGVLFTLLLFVACDAPVVRTPDRIARGRYLVEGVAHCFQCHGEIDPATGQPRAGTKGAGTDAFPDDAFKWLAVPNITPDRETGAGTWTDAQLADAIRNGIGHDGRKLIALMPYPAFRSFSDEDLASVIAYLRTIPPIRRKHPKTVIPREFANLQLDLPVVRTVPSPHFKTREERGAWLATIADCEGCHTPTNERFEPLSGMQVAGGQLFHGPYGEVTTPNLTRDASGIPYYDKAVFIKTIRTGRVNGVRELNPVMPWSYLRNLTDDDLDALFAWLQSRPAVRHYASRHEAIAYCRICKTRHGGGALN
ncbi:MAG TPA: cytochrome c [Thermoanaerobaculia bacterium]|nr:cytochrome c [Thermoanaerobaculia bacterium]